MATELVDAYKLAACCTAEANAIRAKTGSSAQISYDWANSKGFADAIATIPSGSDELPGILANTTNVLDDDTVTAINRDFAFRGLTSLQKVYLANLASSTKLGSPFYECSNLEEVAMPKLTTAPNNTSGSFQFCSKLQIADIGGWARLGGNEFSGCTLLNTLILRRTSITVLASTNTFNNSPFASGGTGGTIYIPESLYNHLGDGGSNDYKAASNWATIDGYGTITWAKIEGSLYDSLTWWR